jgi:hypothetical protein
MYYVRAASRPATVASIIRFLLYGRTTPLPHRFLPSFHAQLESITSLYGRRLDLYLSILSGRSSRVCAMCVCVSIDATAALLSIHTALRAAASHACHAIYSCICGTLCCWAIELRTNCASILGKVKMFAMVLCISMHA